MNKKNNFKNKSIYLSVYIITPCACGYFNLSKALKSYINKKLLSQISLLNIVIPNTNCLVITDQNNTMLYKVLADITNDLKTLHPEITCDNVTDFFGKCVAIVVKNVLATNIIS